jgi:orotate phosphoribosyltransferase
MNQIEEQLQWRHVPGASAHETRRRELARDIVAAACVHGRFVYASGVRSDIYFDKYLFVTRPTILRRLASLLAELLSPRVDRLAGAGLGATALVAALSLETGLPFVVVRENDNLGAAHERIEGELHAGERTVVVEDVVSTGRQAVRAASVITARGGVVDSVLGAIDREEGGAQHVAAAGMQLRSLFTIAELGVK